MKITTATSEYEAWLEAALHAPLVRADLDEKRRLMEKPFPFFRGTYYRWAQRWAEAAGPLADTPKVLAVGDIHIENFGTWRDEDGRLCWGVNDFDEADELPYTHDLVRLAASVCFARKSGDIVTKNGDACHAILDGYRGCLKDGGRPFVLEEHHAQLRTIAMHADREPVKFWEKTTKPLNDPPPNDLPADAVAALADVLPTKDLKIEYRARLKAGVGSLGRRRYVALAQWAGGWICREAKAVAPPATAWASGTKTPNRTAKALEGAMRAPDPFYRISGAWVVRRLAPRSSRIELDDLKGADTMRVLHAMGCEVGNVHLGTADVAAILADLGKRSGDWLSDAAKEMAELIEADWEAWQAR